MTTAMYLAGFASGASTLGGSGAAMYYTARRRWRARADAYRSQAMTDGLTGLPNRTGFRALAADLTGGAGDHLIAVLLLDLDGFKAVNDERGHAVGDRMLQAVGHRLAAAVGQSGVAARLGGDEFVVLAPLGAAPADEDLEDVRTSTLALAAAVHAEVAQPLAVENTVLAVRSSIGCTYGPAGRFGDLLTASDAGMYAAKRAGCGVSYQPVGAAPEPPRGASDVLAVDGRPRVRRRDIRPSAGPRHAAAPSPAWSRTA